METLYHWVGFAIVWAAIFGAGAVTGVLLFGLIGAGWGIALRKYRWLNYRWYFLGKLLRTFIWPNNWLRKSSEFELANWLRWLNNRDEPRAMRLRREAPFYRWLYAYEIRRRRSSWMLYWHRH